jgi:hypothetical protein
MGKLSAVERGKYWTKSVSCATGCTPINDPAHPCAHCWARDMVRLRPQTDGGNGFRPTFHADWLPRLRTRKPEVVFANIMGDWMHEAFTPRNRWEQIDRMAATTHSVFLTCTKRWSSLAAHWEGVLVPPNVWNGVTIWNTPSAIRGIDRLCRALGYRWVSAEPLLGTLDLERDLWCWLNWLTVGPETGPGRRPTEPQWIRDAIDQAHQAGIPVWVKAFPVGKHVSHDPAEWPAWARVRELPRTLEWILRP